MLEPAVRYADLADKGVFITGGASGIGADLVRAFAAQGSRILFIDLDEAAGAALQQELGASVAFQPCDVTDTAALQGAIDRFAEQVGGLAALINNAANDQRRAAEEADEAFWEASVAVNLKQQYFAAQAAFRRMKPAGAGSIVNFGSIAPVLGERNLSIYGACKSAVKGMTRTLAREFGDHGVRVNAIVPGAILTEKQLKLWISPEDEARILERQCLHRRLTGADIAPVALFLASEASEAITSQSIVVDGGMTGIG